MGKPAGTARWHGPVSTARRHGQPARPAGTARRHGQPARPAGTDSPPGLWAMPGQSVGVHGPARLGPSFKWAGTAQHVDPLSPRKIGPSRPGTACWTGQTLHCLFSSPFLFEMTIIPFLKLLFTIIALGSFFFFFFSFRHI